MTTALESIPVKTIEFGDASLADYSGKVRLVVNTASKCGLTPQFEALEALHRAFASEGFTVLGFPSNDFAGQEPLEESEIKQFCTATYKISFPMFAKIHVAGKDKHPLYAALVSERPKTDAPDDAMRSNLKKFGVSPNDPPEVLWNFEKFLIDRDGVVIGRYPPDLSPKDPAMLAVVRHAL